MHPLAREPFAQHAVSVMKEGNREFHVHTVTFLGGHTYTEIMETAKTPMYCCQPNHPGCRNAEKEFTFSASPWTHHVIRRIAMHTFEGLGPA
jgi:hypothetical protein